MGAGLPRADVLVEQFGYENVSVHFARVDRILEFNARRGKVAWVRDLFERIDVDSREHAVAVWKATNDEGVNRSDSVNRVAPAVGFEPTTKRLTAAGLLPNSCSEAAAPRRLRVTFQREVVGRRDLVPHIGFEDQLERRDPLLAVDRTNVHQPRIRPANRKVRDRPGSRRLVSFIPSGLGRALRLKLGDLGPGGRDKLLVRVGVSHQAPAALDRLGEQDPRPLREREVAGRLSDDRREAGHDRQLLGAIERPRIRQHLDPDVGAVAIDIGNPRGRQLVDEGRGVLYRRTLSRPCAAGRGA
jgi:hypothetical protein